MESGQAHRWKNLGDGWYSGVLGPRLIHVRQNCQGVEYRAADASDAVDPEVLNGLLWSYFRLDDDICVIYRDIRRDRRVAEMVSRYPGLRILRQDPWECTVAFICSATSNIPRIHQNMEANGRQPGHAPWSWTENCGTPSRRPNSWPRPGERFLRGGWVWDSAPPTWWRRRNGSATGSWTWTI